MRRRASWHLGHSSVTVLIEAVSPLMIASARPRASEISREKFPGSSPSFDHRVSQNKDGQLAVKGQEKNSRRSVSQTAVSGRGTTGTRGEGRALPGHRLCPLLPGLSVNPSLPSLIEGRASKAAEQIAPFTSNPAAYDSVEVTHGVKIRSARGFPHKK